MPDLPFRFSYSQLSMYLKCGEQYRRCYVEGEKRPASLAMNSRDISIEALA